MKALSHSKIIHDEPTRELSSPCAKTSKQLEMTTFCSLFTLSFEPTGGDRDLYLELGGEMNFLGDLCKPREEGWEFSLRGGWETKEGDGSLLFRTVLHASTIIASL